MANLTIKYNFEVSKLLISFAIIKSAQHLDLNCWIGNLDSGTGRTPHIKMIITSTIFFKIILINNKGNWGSYLLYLSITLIKLKHACMLYLFFQNVQNKTLFYKWLSRSSDFQIPPFLVHIPDSFFISSKW